MSELPAELRVRLVIEGCAFCFLGWTQTDGLVTSCRAFPLTSWLACYLHIHLWAFDRARLM